jgi:enoyl-CoA hydratase
MATTISSTDRVIAEKDGAIGWVIFNNPARRNAMSSDMYEILLRVLEDYERDAAIRVVVLKGAGDKAFISGADISQRAREHGSAEHVAAHDQISNAGTTRLHELRKPTIAMIHGYCLGGGLAMALQCDLRLADETGRFGIPAAKLGVGYRVNGTKQLVDLVGPAYAKEIFFTGRQFTAGEALEMGLLNRVVPEAELEGYVRDYCRRIAENAPLSIEASKGIINELGKLGPQIDLERCDALVKRCSSSQDLIEGRLAFLEKRQPAFTGK